MTSIYETWMEIALQEAKSTGQDVPVGSALFDRDGALVGKSRNTRESDGSVLGHAESNAIIDAWGSSLSGRLSGFTLVTTLEPCVVCASIVRETEISRVVFGASNPQRGAGGSVFDLLRDKRLGRPIEVIAGVRSRECQRLLDEFFAEVRNVTN